MRMIIEFIHQRKCTLRIASSQSEFLPLRNWLWVIIRFSFCKTRPSRVWGSCWSAWFSWWSLWEQENLGQISVGCLIESDLKRLIFARGAQVEQQVGEMWFRRKNQGTLSLWFLAWSWKVQKSCLSLHHLHNDDQEASPKSNLIFFFWFAGQLTKPRLCQSLTQLLKQFLTSHTTVRLDFKTAKLKNSILFVQGIDKRLAGDLFFKYFSYLEDLIKGIDLEFAERDTRNPLPPEKKEESEMAADSSTEQVWKHLYITFRKHRYV